MPQLPHVGIYLGDLRADIEERYNPDNLSKFVRESIELRCTIDEKADAYAGDLPDGWWDDGLDRYLEWRRAHPEVAEEQDHDREEIAHEAD